MIGNLQNKRLADLIRELYLKRESGELAIELEENRKSIYFKKGSIVFSSPSDPHDRLGERLVRDEVITQAQLDEAVMKKPQGKRLGQVLVSLGHFTEKKLLEAVTHQILSNIYPVFSWREGDFTFEHKDQPVDEDLELNFSTADIIMEGIRKTKDVDFMAERLGATDRVIVLSSNPMLRFQSIHLQPLEGFILSRIDGFLTIDQVCSITPMPEENIHRCIYGLLSTGILELRGEEESQEEDLYDMDGNIAGFFSDLAGTEEELERARFVGDEAVLSEEEQKEKDEIFSFYESFPDKNYYEILGITVEADDSAVKKAYHLLAKKYHPDRHHKANIEGIREALEKIFIKINEAYQTLANQERRILYNRDHLSLAPSAEGTPQPVEQENIGANREKMGMDCYLQGKQFFEEGDFFRAIQVYRKATEYCPNKGNYFVQLAIALSMNPKWRKEAEENLLKAIEMDSFKAEPYAQLGKLYLKAGLVKRAKKRFLEALRWDQANHTALKGLEEIETNSKQGFAASLKARFREKK